MEKANNQIQSIRKDKGKYHNRDQYYEDCEIYIEKLKKIVEIFSHSEHLIINKDNEKNNESIKKSRRFKLNLGFVILSIVVSLMIAGMI